jgi:hypothetical protein
MKYCGRCRRRRTLDSSFLTINAHERIHNDVEIKGGFKSINLLLVNPAVDRTSSKQLFLRLGHLNLGISYHDQHAEYGTLSTGLK